MYVYVRTFISLLWIRVCTYIHVHMYVCVHCQMCSLTGTREAVLGCDFIAYFMLRLGMFLNKRKDDRACACACASKAR